MPFVALDKTENLHDTYRKVFNINGHNIMLIQHKGVRSALESLCPHSAYPMDDAKIVGSALRCPMHGYLFEIATGECTLSTEGPCRSLHYYDLIYRDGQVGVLL